jgi:hypothetical protein
MNDTFFLNLHLTSCVTALLLLKQSEITQMNIPLFFTFVVDCPKIIFMTINKFENIEYFTNELVQ